MKDTKKSNPYQNWDTVPMMIARCLTRPQSAARWSIAYDVVLLIIAPESVKLPHGQNTNKLVASDEEIEASNKEEGKRLKEEGL